MKIGHLIGVIVFVSIGILLGLHLTGGSDSVQKNQMNKKNLSETADGSSENTKTRKVDGEVKSGEEQPEAGNKKETSTLSGGDVTQYMEQTVESPSNTKVEMSVVNLRKQLKQYRALKGHWPESLSELKKWTGIFRSWSLRSSGLGILPIINH